MKLHESVLVQICFILLRTSYLKTTAPIQMVDQKQPDNVEYFNYFGSMRTNEGWCTR